MPHVLITGANRGLGLGLTRVFLEDGWQVTATVRKPSPELEALAGGQLEIEHCNLVDDVELAGLASRLAKHPLDVLINNAGRMAWPQFRTGEKGLQGFGHFDRERWRKVFDINLFTPMHLAELLADNVAKAERGRIVTISSMLGSMALNTTGGLYAYRASKAAVNAITKSMGIDLAQRGIIAVAMHPGWVRTDMGGQEADMDIDTSVRGMKRVIDGLQTADSGKFLAWDGKEMPW